MQEQMHTEKCINLKRYNKTPCTQHVNEKKIPGAHVQTQTHRPPHTQTCPRVPYRHHLI